MLQKPLLTKIASKVCLSFIGSLMIGSAGAQVLITEFMAKNDNTLLDGDGNSSDWIELYNSGTSAVDLTGWYLSDDAANLTEWAFPTQSIAAGEHLVVFASGQDVVGYADSLGYLHTTFKLNGDTESVILTQADGTTIEDSFIDYPVQSDDISYGLSQDSGFSSLVVEEQDATAIAGTAEPASTWNTLSFDDSSWQSGQTGVGYEDLPPGGTSVYGSLINLDLESTMVSGGRPPSAENTAYVRVDFTVADASVLSQLVLRMKYDDGFVAYINGTEVASANAPASPTYDSTALAEHTGSAYEDFTILNVGSFLQTGNNVLAVHSLDYPVTPGPGGGTFDLFALPVLTGITAGAIDTNSAVYLSTPTPGADNVIGVQGFVDDTSFSIDRGFYTSAINVEVTCLTVGSEIYYTTDGTIPTTSNGTLYTGAIPISQTTILRAAAFLTGYQESNVDTQTYIFLSDIIAQSATVTGLDPYFPPNSVNGQVFDYGMDADITNSATYSGEMDGALKAIPTISMVTDPDNLFSASSGIYVNASESGEAWERETSLELINPDGSPGFQINGGVRIRGASSTRATNPKHNFRFFFRSEYGTTRLEYPLFGDEGADSYKRIDLRTGQNFSWSNQNPQYATWLYDIYTRDTHRDMNQPYTRGEYYHLYINGMYWGLYQTEERCNADFAESYYGDDDDDFDAVKSDADTGDNYAVDGTRDAYEDLWAGMTAGVTSNADYFELQGMNSDGTVNSSYTKLLDVDNVIDYMLLTYFTGNRDSPIGPPNSGSMPRNLNMVYNRLNPDGFKFVAHDNEHSLEVSEGVNFNRLSHNLASSFDGIDRLTPWWIHVELMDNTEYKLRFADRVHKHFFNDGALTTAQNQNRVEARKAEIFSAVVAESARWGDSESTSPRTRNDDWLTWADWLTDTYMSGRTSTVYSQIVAKGWYPTVAAPVFSQHGGGIASGTTVSMTGSGTIYYTTDGTDPRAVGGSVAGTAYSSSITLSESTEVQARVLSGSTWSALTCATFEVSELSPLRVTEIMYHPAEGESGDELNYGDEEFEFIELLNTGSETIGLAGTAFTGGIYFQFSEGDVLTLAPGEYVLLVDNIDAFTARYPTAGTMNIAGEYHGQFYLPDAELNNGGETISLVDSLGRTIQEFTYDDAWYPTTDGDGYSLTIIDPADDTSTWSTSAAWGASTVVGGTPGEVDVNPDSDADGMLDSWEIANGLTVGVDDSAGDADGDGSSNLSEYLAGTDPQDSGSLLLITSLGDSSGGLMAVGWSAIAGKTYQFSTSVDLETWTDITPTIPCAADGTLTTDITTTGMEELFLRVSVVSE
ncbi:MAG: lamin tail domain-containing protein [Roseibacillus sp.]